VIVVTGPGRSGTSFLARLYSELGFDPGGRWEPAVSAGFEDREIVETNLQLAKEMGVSIRERRGGRTLQALGGAVRLSEGRVKPGVRRPLARAVDALRYSRETPDLMRWDSVGDVVARHGERLRSLAKVRQVAKDPRFSFTLRAWLASGAQIDSVVFTIRPLDAMADSRVRVHMYSERARDWARHNYCYGIGLLWTAVTEHRLPVSVVRYPDLLEDPKQLYEQLPMPEPRSKEDFERAFASVYDPSLVHDDR
jgi:hypothetical protein